MGAWASEHLQPPPTLALRAQPALRVSASKQCHARIEASSVIRAGLFGSPASFTALNRARGDAAQFSQRSRHRLQRSRLTFDIYSLIFTDPTSGATVPSGRRLEFALGNLRGTEAI
jgi:hypothetical protein